MHAGITPERAIIGPLLDLVSAPAYVTDRFNRVRAVNHRYAELVGDPIDDGYRGEQLFIISLILGPYSQSFPRRQVDVAGCTLPLAGEIEHGRLEPQTQLMLRTALQMDASTARQVRGVLEGSVSQKWDGRVVYRQENRKHVVLEETVIPLQAFGLGDAGPRYLNIWMPPEQVAHRESEDLTRSLTAREREIASLFALGHTSREVAEIAGISLHTAHDHRDHIYGKLGIGSRAELAQIMLPELHR